MEMHAVSDLGSYESLAERALMAGNDIILFCSHIERVPELQRAHERIAENEHRHRRARRRGASESASVPRAHRASARRTPSRPPQVFDDVIDEAIRFVDKLEQTRPHREVFIPDSERRKQGRTPGKGTHRPRGVDVALSSLPASADVSPDGVLNLEANVEVQC